MDPGACERRSSCAPDEGGLPWGWRPVALARPLAPAAFERASVSAASRHRAWRPLIRATSAASCAMVRQTRSTAASSGSPWCLSGPSERAPDVLLLQETKRTDEAWPGEAFVELGYESYTSARAVGPGSPSCPASDWSS